ncbi:hypothetical protein [Niallia nealsonii]|uniref:hypothetical protein n=1 Tax=Niallia nealsonii TaxID=115979 RepID=UPI0012FE994F|nr:hypothetical protein [Niallia nealsonii]
MKKKKTESLNHETKPLHPGIRGESIDELARTEAANSILAEKEIGQQRENL